MPDPAIRLFPDPILRLKAAEVDLFDRALEKTVGMMRRIMESQPSGIGIAAPQIGISKQIALVDVSKREPRAQLLIMVNPVILEVAEERASREGCMSLPDYTAPLKRFNRVLVRWQGLRGEYYEKAVAGIEAVCIQHEIDHLKGLLFFDRVTSLKRDMIPRREGRLQ